MLKEQFTQTLLTLEDIESLLHGLVPSKILLVDLNPCGVSLDITDLPANEPCDVAQETTEGTENYVESTCFENTDDMHMFNVHSMCDTKLLVQSKNKNNTMKGVEELVKLISKRAKHQAKNTKDNFNRLQLSKSDICVSKNRNSQRHYNKRGKRKGHKTKSKILFRNYKTAEPSEGKCSKESNNEQDQDVTNFRCYCSKPCVSKKSLQKHIRNHEKDKEYSCDKCGNKCLHENGLCLESQTHTEERSFKCAACGKAFISSSALRRHQLVHMRGRDAVVLSHVEATNVCPSCGKTFSQKGNLTVHMKIHVGRYDHVCKTCQKQFITSGDLKRHERVHSREKPYTCDNCQKSFSTSSTLVCHMRSHSGERPYLCGVCGATFAILSHLKQHNKIHARGDLWPRRKGASATGQNIRRKALHGIKQADKDKTTGSTFNSESKQKKDPNTDNKDVSLVANSLQLPDLPSVDLVDSSIQPSSNSLFINSAFPSTVYSIHSPRGFYVGEKVRGIKSITDAGSDVQMVEVTSSSHNIALDTEECEKNTGNQLSVISQRDTTAISVQRPPSADSTVASRTFIKLSDVISPSNNGPFQCSIAESTVSLYNPRKPTTIARGNNISVCDRLYSYVSPVMPLVQHISRSSNAEHIQTKDTLTVATHGIQYVTSSFCEDKGVSNYPTIPSGVHNNISCAVQPATTTCSNVHALISSKELDSTSSLTFQTVEHGVNSLSFSTPVNVGSITSDAATAVLTNKVDSFDSVPSSITSLSFSGMNSSFSASFLSSNIYIGHDTPGMSSDQSVTFIRNAPTSPCCISLPSSSSNVFTIMPAAAVSEKSASIVGSAQQGGGYPKR